ATKTLSVSLGSTPTDQTDAPLAAPQAEPELSPAADNSQDALAIVLLNDGSVQLSFRGDLGTSVRLQAAPDLAPSAWRDTGLPSAQDSSGTYRWIVPTTGEGDAQHFFRVIQR